MKLVSFLNNGVASYGILEGTQIRDISHALSAQWPDLKAMLGQDYRAVSAEVRDDAPVLNLADVELLPPIPNPAKVFCIGHNYEEHRVETGRPKTTFPAVFLRFADTLVPHGQSGWVPASSVEVDYEGELAVVIGRSGRHIPRVEALEHVAGYSCFNDISIRDWQRHTSQFTPGKNFPHTGGFGPWIVTADEIEDPQELELTTRLNGETVQHATTAQMIFPVNEIIEYISSFTQLYPGDVIASGTPGGVGVRRTPQLFMKAGDAVEVEIGSIGTLRIAMVAEAVAGDASRHHATR
jgi:2-keto-4-pentenoate hydratase/2-oxohepta-3-ene-1,7-dioic acid hydratase in catechol pathway